MSVYLFCHDYEPAVLGGVFAGGERNKLISIFSGHARIIQSKLLALPDISIKLFFVFCIDKIIIAVAL